MPHLVFEECLGCGEKIEFLAWIETEVECPKCMQQYTVWVEEVYDYDLDTEVIEHILEPVR